MYHNNNYIYIQLQKMPEVQILICTASEGKSLFKYTSIYVYIGLNVLH